MNKYNTSGLTEKEVISNRKKYGTNALNNKNKNTFLSLLYESLGDPIIKILLIALAVKIVFLFKDFDWYETIGILVAIFLASFISTISEYGSNKAFEKMQEESSRLQCKVKRDNKLVSIPIDEVVVDDIILLEQGDKIPADGIIIEGKLTADESSINGESKESYKEAVKDKIKNKNTVYKGTTIYDGTATMIVTKVGVNTFYGKIANELSEKDDESPLKTKLRTLAKIISTFGYIGAVLASVSYLFKVIVIDNNYDISNILSTLGNIRKLIDYVTHALTLAVTIIIVSVPEGLPMMITLVLSSNMKRMLKNNVLVRKMVGIETSGSINILFSDKTGTITDGMLSCNKIIDGNLTEYKKEKDLKDNNFTRILKISMAINNQSKYGENGIVGGNSTDRCLLSFFKPFKIDGVKIEKQIPFDSKNKYMITVINDNKIRNIIKGAPEVLLDSCKYYYDSNGKQEIFKNKKQIKDLINNATKKGYRVIALATSNNYDEKLFRNLCFVSIVFIKDNIRKEAKEAIKLVKDAGVHTVMITGDNKDTAINIASEVGLITDTKNTVLTSDELNSLSDEQLKKIIPSLAVVARSLPQDKSRLVRVAKEMNYIVGMTGDGVNDAPALKRADVGFAFGSGSEVAKEASQIVILDNNFLSISKAILFGRTIFKSIRKFVVFQLTVNLCALLISILGPFIGVDTPVTVMQMLWINMVMDTLAGLAFAYEPPLLEYMKEKPKSKNEHIINSYMTSQIVITGLYTTLLCILFLKLPLVKNFFETYDSFMTAFFVIFIFMGIFNCFNARTHRINILANLNKNKPFILVILFIFVVQLLMIYYGGNLFRTIPLSLKELIITFLISITVIPFDMIRKILYKYFNKNKSITG